MFGGGEIQLCVFPTMLSLRLFDKQQDMWSESADFNLMFPSAEAEITFIYMQDVFTDLGSMWSSCKQWPLVWVYFDRLTQCHIWACACTGAYVFVWWHFHGVPGQGLSIINMSWWIPLRCGDMCVYSAVWRAKRDGRERPIHAHKPFPLCGHWC